MLFFEQILDKLTDTLGEYKSFDIIKVELDSETARLYDNEKVEWGKVDIDFVNLDDKTVHEEYWFTVEPLKVDFRKLANKAKDLRAHTSNQDAVQDTILETKILHLAYFQNGG